MKFEKAGKQVTVNGNTITRETLVKIFKRHFGKTSWERLWQDIEKYGRVHVAFVFVNKGKDRLK